MELAITGGISTLDPKVKTTMSRQDVLGGSGVSGRFQRSGRVPPLVKVMTFVCCCYPTCRSQITRAQYKDA